MTAFRKIVGAILIFLATGAYGFGMSSKFKRQLNELKEIEKMLILLKGEIACLKTPLPEALKRIAARLKAPVGKILTAVYERYLEDEKNSLPFIWETEWKDKETAFHLTQKELDQISSFGTCMGLADAATQLATVDMHLRETEREIQELEEVVPGKSRLYRNLSILCGMMIVLILL